MKSQNLFLLLITSTLLVFSCKNKATEQPAEEVVETEIDEVPNPSDIHFEMALNTFKDSKNKDAAMHIREGIEALQKEAADTARTVNKSALDKAVKDLSQLATDIEADKVRDTDRLRQSFANAALTVSHDYLAFEDVFILEKPEKVNSSKLNRAFDKAHKSFKGIKKDLPESAKKEYENIEAETKALQKKRQELDKDISDHLKKMREFVRKHQPEKVDNFPYYGFE